jgi:hypothetical protein
MLPAPVLAAPVLPPTLVLATQWPTLVPITRFEAPINSALHPTDDFRETITVLVTTVLEPQTPTITQTRKLTAVLSFFSISEPRCYVVDGL